MTTQEILEAARAAKTVVALASSETRTHALWAMSDWLCHPENMEAILAANAEDMAAAKGHISDVMLDRLALTEERIGAMARGILEVAALPDPVGRVLKRVEHPNGLVIEKTAVPMGVIAIIYESRPNVTSDAAALAIKSGNACILRCGKEAWRSANAIVKALRQGLVENGLPEAAVSLIEDTSHASANALMTAVGYVDLLIPRGGAGLIRACVQNAKVPCIQTGTAARDQQIHIAYSGHQSVGRSVGGVLNQADRCLGQTGLFQALPQGCDDGVGTAPCFLAAAQDTGIAALDGKGSGIAGHIGAALVDNGDHAHGHSRLFNDKPVGALHPVQHPAHRVGQGRYLPDALRHGFNARCGQGQTV